MKNKRFTAVATAAAIMLGVCGCAGNTASSTVGGSTDVSSASSEAKSISRRFLLYWTGTPTARTFSSMTL